MRKIFGKSLTLPQPVSHLRMFAGPNGSGKSTLKAELSDELLGVYVNPDEIESEINRAKKLDFDKYQIHVDCHSLSSFIMAHALFPKLGVKNVFLLETEGNFVNLPFQRVNPYLVSILSDYIRRELVKKRISFSFETVMSSPDKLEFLKLANKNKFQTHLYFISTEDPLINVSRVDNRVAKGGHPVPENKIIERYERTMSMLVEAVKLSHEALIFDNSGREIKLIAKVANGKKITVESNEIPQWVNKYLLKI